MKLEFKTLPVLKLYLFIQKGRERRHMAKKKAVKKVSHKKTSLVPNSLDDTVNHYVGYGVLILVAVVLGYVLWMHYAA